MQNIIRFRKNGNHLNFLSSPPPEIHLHVCFFMLKISYGIDKKQKKVWSKACRKKASICFIRSYYWLGWHYIKNWITLLNAKYFHVHISMNALIIVYINVNVSYLFVHYELFPHFTYENVSKKLLENSSWISSFQGNSNISQLYDRFK